MTAVDAVIFDWGGTLTPWHAVDLHEQWASYTRVYEPERVDELAELLLAAELRAWQAARDFQRSATLDDVFREAGVEPSGRRHEEALAAFETFWEPHTLVDPDAPPLLHELRNRGVKVGVLSNTLWRREFHEEVFRRDGMLDLVDGAVYTSEIPYTKPHPEAFRAAMASVGVTAASRVVFVGDRLYDDVHGAKAVGMRAVLVPHSDIPVDQRGPVDGEPDAVVHRLADLMGVLEGWAEED